MTQRYLTMPLIEAQVQLLEHIVNHPLTPEEIAEATHYHDSWCNCERKEGETRLDL